MTFILVGTGILLVAIVALAISSLILAGRADEETERAVEYYRRANGL